MVFSRDSTTEGIGEFPSRKSSTHDFFKTSPRFESWRERLHSTIFEKQYEANSSPKAREKAKKNEGSRNDFSFSFDLYIVIDDPSRNILS